MVLRVTRLQIEKSINLKGLRDAQWNYGDNRQLGHSPPAAQQLVLVHTRGSRGRRINPPSLIGERPLGS
jgi:hypothetical protein